MKEKVREEVKKEAKEGKLACKNALAMGERLGCGPALVGEVANEEGIKIVACSLGCF